MKEQRGAALVIVMALLTGAMVVGVAGMQSTLVDERLAGNYRASAQAQMAAEDVAGYIQKDYSTLPKPADIEKKEDGWRFLKLENRYSKKNKSFSLKGSYTECNVSSGNDDCNLVYDRGGKGWMINDNLSFPFYIARGQVFGSKNSKAVAESLVIVGNVARAEFPPPLEDYADYAVLSSGAVSGINPSSNIDGKYKDNAGLINVPDPGSKHPSDTGRSGYISDIRDMAESGSDAVVKACDARKIDDMMGIDTKYVYCGGYFSGDVGSSVNGLIIVSASGFSNIKPKSDVEASFVSGGSVEFKGFGNNTLKGVVWSSGSVAIKGRSNIEGGVYSNASIQFSGKTSVTGDSGSPGYVWRSVP